MGMIGGKKLKHLKVKQKWNLFWAVSFGIFSFLIVWAGHYLKIDNLAYFPLATLFFVLTGIFFGLAIKFTAGEHRFFHHPISFVGQTSVLGKLNRKAFTLFILYTFSICTLPFLLAHLIGQNFDELSFTWLRNVLYFATLAIIMMGLVPIDVDRPKHLVATYCVFICGVTINIMAFIYSRVLGGGYVGYSIFAVIQLLSSLLYLIGYFRDVRASMFQKIWLILVMISIYLYIILFVGVI